MAQGKYLALHNSLFASRLRLHEQKALVVAGSVGKALGAYQKFLGLHQALFASGRRFTEEKVLRIAASAGLDIARLKEDMQAPEIDAIIERNKSLADSIGIRGTPALVVGHEVRVGATSSKALKEMIARARS